MISNNSLSDAIPEVLQILDKQNTPARMEGAENNAVEHSANKMALSLLNYATSYNNLEVLKYAIEQGLEPNKKYEDEDEECLVTHFIESNNLKAVQFLIDQGAPIPNYNKNGYATIGVAINNNSFEMAQLLHQHGAATDLWVEQYDDDRGREHHPDHVGNIIFSSHSSFPNFFAVKWLETFGWPRDTAHWRYHRSTFARNIFDRVTQEIARNDRRDEQSSKKLLALVFQEYEIPNPPSLHNMQFLECQINKEFYSHPGEVQKIPPFRFNDYLNRAILREEYPLLEFLLKSNWIHDFQVPFGNEKRLVSPVWAAAPKTENSMWNTLIQSSSLVERARMDYRELPSTFFPLLSQLPLHELENMKDLGLDFTAADPNGDTFFHYLSSQADLKKGHLHFSVDVGAELAFSLKNNQGHTPFDIPHTKGYDRGELQSYFEQRILPRTLRKTLKELPKPVPAATRRRM